MSKRWTAAGGTPAKTNINPPVAGSKAGSAAGSGTSTPYGPRPGLVSTVLVEVDEEEMDVDEMEKVGVSGGYGLGLAGSGFAEDRLGDARIRSFTESTVSTQMSGSALGETPSTAFTTPDMTNSPFGTTSGTETNGSAAAPSTPAALQPVTAMPTSEAETQMGLAKVAEPDVDAFMSYAAIVPEFCRLESMLVKALV